MIVQTVATVNYLHYATMLIKSLKKYNRYLTYSILVTDVSRDRTSQVRDILDEDGIEIFCCEDLEIDYLDKMRGYYSALEFNAACKILAIDFQLRKRNVAECLCLDADIYALGNIENIFMGNDYDIMVTPTTLSPNPWDGNLPSDLEIIMCGYISGGVIYFRNSKVALEALDWLKKNTKFNWFIAPKYGMHAEQNWLSALPYFFRKITHVSEVPSLHIHYLNLHERNLVEDHGIYKINNEPALLLHFSGFSTPSGGKLTKHSKRKFSEDTERTLVKIISDYESLILQEKERFKELKSDIEFCNNPLHKRMASAEAVWKIKYISFDSSGGFFERAGRRLDRFIMKK